MANGEGDFAGHRGGVFRDDLPADNVTRMVGEEFHEAIAGAEDFASGGVV